MAEPILQRIQKREATAKQAFSAVLWIPTGAALYDWRGWSAIVFVAIAFFISACIDIWKVVSLQGQIVDVDLGSDE